jgi:hypothetical protein
LPFLQEIQGGGQKKRGGLPVFLRFVLWSCRTSRLNIAQIWGKRKVSLIREEHREAAENLPQTTQTPQTKDFG